MNRCNAGGPLVNQLCEVIGVHTAIISETGGSIGLGFAVPSRRASQVIDELRESGSIDRSYYIGLYGVTVTQRIASALGLNRTTGVLIRDVDPSALAVRRSEELTSE